MNVLEHLAGLKFDKRLEIYDKKMEIYDKEIAVTLEGLCYSKTLSESHQSHAGETQDKGELYKWGYTRICLK